MFGSGPILISHLKRGSLFDGEEPSSQKGSLFRGYPILAPHPESAAWMARGEWSRPGSLSQKLLPAWGGVPVWGQLQGQPHSHQTLPIASPSHQTIPPRPLPNLPSPDRCPFQAGPCPLTAQISSSDLSAALCSDGGEPGAGGLSFLWGCHCSFFHPTALHFPSRSPKNW